MLSQQNIKFSLIVKQLATILLFVFFILFSNQVFSQKNNFKVVIDAGHGGKDPGTLGLQTFKQKYESYIALKVTLKVGELLKKETDIKTIYTRTNNKTFVGLQKRGKIANKADADLFISIHCNAAANKKAYGTSSYVLGMGKTAKNLEVAKRENNVILLEDDRETNYSYDPNSQEFLIGMALMQEEYLDKSIEFASIVQGKFSSVAKRKNRGVHQANLAVLYYSYMPSVLIEIGFLTNKAEERFLHSNTGQNKIALAIYKAIVTYKKRLEKNSIGNSKVTIPNKKNEIVTNTTTTNKYYKIQIATNTKKLATKSYNFKGLKNIERIKVGNIYKYFYGVANDLKTAKKLQKKAIKTGFTDAFISKFNFDTSTGEVPKLNYDNPINKKSNTSLKKNFDNKVVFKVQIATSPKKIALKSYNFKKLKNVSRVKNGAYYIYYYGTTTDYELVQKHHKEAVKKGYKSAWIVAFKNGKKVSVQSVLKDK